MTTNGSSAVQEPMDKKSSWFLLIYLLIVSILTAYLTYSLWSPKVVPGPPPVPKCSANAAPVLTNLYPAIVSAGSTLSDFLIIGCGFPSSVQVKFNGTQHPALFVDANHISVGLTSSDVAAAGTVVATVSNSGADFGSGVFTVVPPEITWQFLGRGPWTISQETQLLILVLLAGAFGSSIYAMKSLADYKGDGKLYTSWFTYYLIQPLEGAGVAFLLYLVIRGGFLAGTGADVKSVNQYGVCAIAGLAGAFSDTAFLKLREVFQTLFKPSDDRGGKLTLQIGTSNLPEGTVGAFYKQTLEAIRGTAPLKWSVSPPLPAGLALDASTGTISGTPTAVSAKTTYRFTVTDSATPPASASSDLTLEIEPVRTALEITTTTLPAAPLNTKYSVNLQATGGTGPLQWTVTPSLPAGLSLDGNTGIVSGTPTVPGKANYTFTVTDSGKPPSSASSDLMLEVT